MTVGRVRGFLDYRIYVNGYDLSGYSRNIGPLSKKYEDIVDDAITYSTKKHWIGQSSISPGTLNGMLDDTASSGLHAVMNSAGVTCDLLTAIGKQAAPADGDIAFCGQFLHREYLAGESGGLGSATINFGDGQYATSSLDYKDPWGRLLCAYAAKTAANTATGYDNYIQASTALGGWMMYQVFAAAGTGSITATLKVQDADANENGSFGDLLSSGELSLGSDGTFTGPFSGVVALAKTATVKQYTRWQIAFGTATSVTCAIAFMRAYVA